MSLWTRQNILRFYINRYPSRGDARIITDIQTGRWTMWICYGNGHLHHFNSPHYTQSEQAALDYALDLLREDARGNVCLDYETVDSDDSDDSDEGSEEDADEDADEDDDGDAEASEEYDDDNLHDSDFDDPEDQGDYDRPQLSDDEEDFDERNNYGNPYYWEESDDSGFMNGAAQMGSCALSGHASFLEDSYAFL